MFARRKRTAADAVALSLHQLEQQNAGLVRLAHFFAFLLVVATSVASLISLAGDTVSAVILALRAHPDTLKVPIVASICISFFLVLAMDTGMLLAAGQIRVKLARKAGFAIRGPFRDARLIEIVKDLSSPPTGLPCREQFSALQAIAA